MHPSSHLHSQIARDTESRRITEARHASIGVPRRRQSAHRPEARSQGLVARLVAVALRAGA